MGKAGDSSEQQIAEKWLVTELSNRLGIKLIKKKWELSESSYFEVDGFCASSSTICEVWSHIGTPKSAQKDKVMTDALKLIFLNDFVFKERGGSNLILLFADEKAAAPFRQKSWMSECLRKYKIKIEVIELPEELHNGILEAQKRQYR